jgi:hypothetical protein
MAQNAAKLAVSEARGRAYEELYQQLDTKEGERDIYKMAKIRERNTRMLTKSNASRTEQTNSWQRTRRLSKLFNGETQSSTIKLDDSFDDTSRRFVRRI